MSRMDLLMFHVLKLKLQNFYDWKQPHPLLIVLEGELEYESKILDKGDPKDGSST